MSDRLPNPARLRKWRMVLALILTRVVARVSGASLARPIARPGRDSVMLMVSECHAALLSPDDARRVSAELLAAASCVEDDEELPVIIPFPASPDERDLVVS
jgi:hypothetical protein